MTTNIVKWGNSQGIRLPKHLLKSIDLTDTDTVEITVVNGSIIIKKANKKIPRKNIKELFKNYQGTYDPVEINWGEPVGKEVW